VDLVVGDEGPDRRQGADQLDARGVETDLLLGLTEGGEMELLRGVVAAAAGKGDLARVAAEVGATLGEDEAVTLVVFEEGY
jgi:hypothetical protein